MTRDKNSSAQRQLEEVLRRLHADNPGELPVSREEEILCEIKSRKSDFTKASSDRSWKKNLPLDGDVNRGATLFSRYCLSCHSLERSWRESKTQGPALGTVMGRVPGGDRGYRYPAFYAPLETHWDRNTLTAYLRSPATYANEESVGCDSSSLKVFQRNEADIADVVEFLYRMGKAHAQSSP